MGLISHPMTYVRAQSIQEAIDVLSQLPDVARVLSGGQSLIPLMKLGLAIPEAIVDISGIGELDYVHERHDDMLEIGALARHSRLERDPIVRRRLPLLSKVARLVGDPQVRSLGTLGGSLAHADPAGDYCMLAIMLDGVVLTNEREVPATEFFEGPFTTSLGPGEMVIGVRFPATAYPHAFLKITRLPFDSGVPSVAVQRLGEGWRVGLTNVGHDRARARAVEEALETGATSAAAVSVPWLELQSFPDEVVPASYRMHMAQVLTGRALDEAQGGGR
jgi:carbon-monoxide dehydrogenase medium subunit